MRKEPSYAVIAAQVVGATIGVIGVLYVLSLFDEASSGEQLTAAAALVAGLIAAAGTALAVYLTLAAQRKDEAEKVEAALRAEVSEFARLAIGQLGLCELVLTKGYQVPLRDLPALMAMPEATVFKATADRVSRLPYGSLFVTLHTRTAEVVQMARIYAASVPPPPLPALGPHAAVAHELTQANRLLDADKAATLATAWLDICDIAHTILTPSASAAELAEASIAQVLKDLESARARVRPMIAPAQGQGDAG